MSELSSHKISAEDKLRSAHDSQQRIIRSMENKQRALQSDLDNSKHELTTLQEEYNQYKVGKRDECDWFTFLFCIDLQLL